jgi:glycosyltransferase involved in cell wall biosynthesis
MQAVGSPVSAQLGSKGSLLLFNHYAVTPDMAGGTRHYDIGKALAARGFDVTVIASACPYGGHRCSRCRNGEEYVVENFLEAPGLRFVWIRTAEEGVGLVSRAISMFSYLPRGTAVARGLIRQHILPEPTWVVGSCVHQFAGLAALRIARKYAVPFIYEVRDLWPETLSELGGWSQHHPAVVASGFMSKYLYRHADEVVTLLPGSESVIVSYGVAASRITVIPNGVDLHRTETASRRIPSTEGSFLVVYAGSHGRANALDQLIDAAARIDRIGDSQLKFLLIGSGPEKGRLQRWVCEDGIHNVIFADPVPKSDIYALLKGADAFFLGTSHTGLYDAGMSMNKLMDYLAVGRPVVLACDAFQNPVSSSGSGYVVPSDQPQLLADTFNHLAMMSPAELAAIGERARLYASQYLSIEHLADLWESVLRGLPSKTDVESQTP